MDWLSTGVTINNDGYCETLTRFRCRIQQQCKGKWSGELLLQHDDVHLHTSHKTCEALTSLCSLCCLIFPIHPTWLQLTMLCSTKSRTQYAVRNFHIVTVVHAFKPLDSVMTAAVFHRHAWNDVLRPHYPMITHTILQLFICRNSSPCPNHSRMSYV
jgi:hypothetical protein